MLALGYFGLAVATFKFATRLRWKFISVIYYLLLYFIFLELINPANEDYNGNMVYWATNIIVLMSHLVFIVLLYNRVEKQASLENARKHLGKEIYLLSNEELHKHTKHRL